MLVAGALLGFDVVLDVNEQAGLPGALIGLAGGAEPAGAPGGQGLMNRSYPGALADMYLPRFSSYPSRWRRRSRSSKSVQPGRSRSMAERSFAL